MIGDWRYVTPGEYAAFGNADSEELRERAFDATAETRSTGQREAEAYDEAAFRAIPEEVPLGSIEMRQAFAPAGDYGRWLRTHDTVDRINGIVFMHGGVSPATAARWGARQSTRPCGGRLRADGHRRAAASDVLRRAKTGRSGTGPGAGAGSGVRARRVAVILDQLGARAIVIGHTVALGRIATRFGGRVVQIDTGMLDGDLSGRRGCRRSRSAATRHGHLREAPGEPPASAARGRSGWRSLTHPRVTAPASYEDDGLAFCAILPSNSLTMSRGAPSAASISSFVRLSPTALATRRARESLQAVNRSRSQMFEHAGLQQLACRAGTPACGRSSTSSSPWSTACCPCSGRDSE